MTKAKEMIVVKIKVNALFLLTSITKRAVPSINVETHAGKMEEKKRERKRD